MKKTGICFLLMVACGFTPAGGNQHVSATGLFSEQELLSLAAEQYQQVLSSSQPPDPSEKDAQMLQEIAGKVNTAIGNYYTQRKQLSVLKSYTWESRLVNKKFINAFSLPGGRTIIGTGMLDWAQSNSALAVVYAHQLAHVLLGHGEQRLKTALQELMGNKKLSELLTGARASDAKDVFMAAYGAGANVGLLPPFSRDQEIEADRLAMVFTAMAGYNPRETIVFWERMGKLANGPRQPVLVTVHPAPAERIAKMQEEVEGLIRKYYAAKTG